MVSERTGELCPTPKRVARGGAPLCVNSASRTPSVEGIPDGNHPIWVELRERVAKFGAPVLFSFEPELGAERYRLRVAESGVEIVARGALGAFRAWTTLEQWVELGRRTSSDDVRLDAVDIEDWPDLSVRGFLLDVSRDRVPRMDTLRSLIEQLARLKYNQLQLYMEHTFAYMGHEEVWRDASPFTAEEIREIDRFCRARGMELVPNQNSFGHFHRWLTHPRYRPLAECPDGYVTAFTPNGEPYSLCAVDPRAFELLADLYAQLLPQFTSTQFNVGLDETFDLGAGRSADVVRERGADRVYVDFLTRVRGLAAEQGRTIQFWGDVVLHHPDRIPDLPKDATALTWGYEADHPFEEEVARFAAAGLRFIVCPGTSSWNSIGGRVQNARDNIARAAKQARNHGALGLLVTDWGDHGHWQPRPVSDPGILFGAAFGWNSAAHEEWGPLDWQSALDRWIYRAPFGRAVWMLGEVGKAGGALNRNGSALFRFLLWAQRSWPHAEVEAASEEGMERARAMARQTVAALPPSRAATDERLWSDEVIWAAELLETAADLGSARLLAGEGSQVVDVTAGARLELAARITALAERHARLWSARSRPGGLRESVGRFRRLAEVLSARSDPSPPT